MPIPRKNPDGLRERAIREVQASGRAVAQVAKDLGIHKEAPRGWVHQAQALDRSFKAAKLGAAQTAR
ncbi:transposase [Streptomyces sp. NPDC056352]|uniref:transposase n=1 Tax=Streptomyces sp. NPDC056352 TaxID=3345791 RepID=UPI0035DE7458